MNLLSGHESAGCTLGWKCRGEFPGGTSHGPVTGGRGPFLLQVLECGSAVLRARDGSSAQQLVPQLNSNKIDPQLKIWHFFGGVGVNGLHLHCF